MIEKGFASGWIYGLVPPSPVQTMSQYPNGVSKEEKWMVRRVIPLPPDRKRKRVA